MGGAPGVPGWGTNGSGGSKGQVISSLPDGGDGGPGGAGGLGGLSSPGPSGHSYALLRAAGSTAVLSGTTLQATNPGFAFPFLPVGIVGEAVLNKQL